MQLRMEDRSTYYRKDRSDKDRLFSADSRQSSDVERQPNQHCIELRNTASEQPNSGTRDFGTSVPPDVTGQVRSRSLERPASASADCRVPPLRWDGVGVWVPNTAAAARRNDRRHPVQRCQTLPCQSVTQTPSATTTRRSRRTKLLSAAGNTLARVWNRRPTKFIRNLTTSRNTTASGETFTVPQHIQEDQAETALTICPKCHGRTVNSRSVGAASASPTETATAPKLPFPTVTQDFETESGYLIGRATSNSPNDVISCRTLPSTSPGEDGQCHAKHCELVEGTDVQCRSEPSANCSVVRVKDALHPEDLLRWKLSLMDRAEGRLPAYSSYVRGNVSSSDDDEDDEPGAKATSDDVGNVSRGRSHAQSPGSQFSFENDFEQALEKPELPTTMTAQNNGNVCYVPAEDENDVERLFDAKLDELLRTKCDVKTDQRQYLSVKDDHETQIKQQYASLCDAVTGRRLETAHELCTNDEKRAAGRACQTVTPSFVADLLHESTNGSTSVVLFRRSSSLPPHTTSLTGLRTTASTTHKSIDSGDVDERARRRPSSPSRASVLHIDDEDNNNWHANVGSGGCRFRSKSVPAASGRTSLLGDNEPPPTERQSVTERPREPNIPPGSASTSCSRHSEETFSDDGEDSDNDRRTLTWRKLRNAVDDAVVELVDGLVATLRRVDGQTTAELKLADADRLRRRLLRNVRTALWTGSELADSSTNNAKDKNDDVERLQMFVNMLLDCSEEDDVHGITGIKKYVMTCPPLETARADDVEYWRRQRSSTIDKEINVFVLRHGVRIDGLHVSVAGRNDLPVNAMPDSRE